MSRIKELQKYVSKPYTAGPLFANQSTLLKLPVPTLSETCDRYIESIKPLVTEEQFKKTIALVDEFKQGPGKILQERLLLRQQQYPNWLSDYWSSYAYMGYRDPVVINVNYFFGTILIKKHLPMIL